MISTIRLINITNSIELLMSRLVTSLCQESTVEKLGIKNQPICNYESNSVDWTKYYKENCLLFKGEVAVNHKGGQPVKFCTVDLVIFPAGINF